MKIPKKNHLTSCKHNSSQAEPHSSAVSCSTDSRREVVSGWQKNRHYLQVWRLTKVINSQFLDPKWLLILLSF